MNKVVHKRKSTLIESYLKDKKIFKKMNKIIKQLYYYYCCINIILIEKNLFFTLKNGFLDLSIVLLHELHY